MYAYLTQRDLFWPTGPAKRASLTARPSRHLVALSLQSDKSAILNRARRPPKNHNREPGGSTGRRSYLHSRGAKKRRALIVEDTRRIISTHRSWHIYKLKNAAATEWRAREWTSPVATQLRTGVSRVDRNLAIHYLPCLAENSPENARFRKSLWPCDAFAAHSSFHPSAYCTRIP